MIQEYGDVADGGMIQHVTMPDNFMSEMETTISQIVGLADDPKMKVIVVDDAIPGTTEAFRRVKEKRPDILCFAGQPQEDPGVISSVADLSVSVDFVSRGYLMVDTAKNLGAQKFVHISSPRHMRQQPLGRPRPNQHQARKDLHLQLLIQTSHDPTHLCEPPQPHPALIHRTPHDI